MSKIPIEESSDDEFESMSGKLPGRWRCYARSEKLHARPYRRHKLRTRTSREKCDASVSLLLSQDLWLTRMNLIDTSLKSLSIIV